MSLPDECNLIRIYGDSQLVIDFCNKTARPKEQILFLLLREMQDLIREFRRA
jgi:hypothetical protein